MASDELRYELREDGVLFFLRDDVMALVSCRSSTRHRVELWKGEILLPPDVGDVSTVSFRRRLARSAEMSLGEIPHLEEDLGRIAVVLEKQLELEDGEGSNGKTLRELLEGLSSPNVAQLLVGYGSQAELFCDPDGEPYATVRVDGHLETWPLRSRGFKNWLRHRYYSEHQGDRKNAPGAVRAQALNDAIAQLEAKAQFEGPEYPVHVRVAEYEGAIYVDLADEA